jgi:hypothetical protein
VFAGGYVVLDHLADEVGRGPGLGHIP